MGLLIDYGLILESGDFIELASRGKLDAVKVYLDLGFKPKVGDVDKLRRKFTEGYEDQNLDKSISRRFVSENLQADIFRLIFLKSRRRRVKKYSIRKCWYSPVGYKN